MAYNLKSLIMTLQEILKPDQKRWDFDDVQPQLKSLLEISASLKQILEKSVVASGPKMERLESQIQDAVHEAEDIIESHMVNQVIPESSSFTIYPPDLEQVIQQLHSVMSFVNGIQISTTSSSVAAAASFSPTNNTVVGLDQDLMELMDRLRGQESKLEIIPILGMGGIGLQRFPQSSRSRLLQPSASAFPTSPKFVGDYERVAPSDVDALPQFPPAHLTHVVGLPRLRFVTAFPSSSASPFGLCLPLIRAPTAAV